MTSDTIQRPSHGWIEHKSTPGITYPVWHPELLRRLNVSFLLSGRELRRLAKAFGDVGDVAEQRLLFV